MTWNEVAIQLPEFVQWAIAKQGPLPDGNVIEEDYERLSSEFREELRN